MKRIYFLAAALTIGGVATAQESSLKGLAPYNGEVKQLSSVERAAGDILFEDDFATTTNWTVDNVGTQGDWVHGTTTPANIDQYMGSMASATAGNGFYSFDGIQFLLGGGVDAQDSRLELNTNIDCSGAGDVTLQFDQRYRAFNSDQTFVDVSTDGGATWPNSYELNADMPTNDPAIQNTVFLRIAGAGSNQVRIRFRWLETTDDDNYGSGYGWMVDDVKVIETWEVDHQINTAYTVMGPQNLDYRLIPPSQIAEMTSWAQSCNNGGAVITNSKLNVDIDGAGTYNGTSAAADLGVDACDSVATTTTFTPAAAGTYNITYYKNGDDAEQVTNNDTLYSSFEVTAPTNLAYSRASTQISGGISNVTSQPGSALKIGNIMDINADMWVNKVRVGLANNNGLSVGQLINVEVQKFDGSAYTYLGETAAYTVATGDESSLVELAFPASLQLSAGDDILVLAVHQGGADLDNDGNPDEVSFAMAQQTLEGSVLGYTADGNSFQLTSPGAIMIQLMEAEVGIEENTAVLNETSIFPNPASESATINYSLNANAQVAIEVVDFAGKTIVSNNLGTVPAGNQIFNLNTANLAEGVYFYNLKVNGEVITNKFTVVK